MKFYTLKFSTLTYKAFNAFFLSFFIIAMLSLVSCKKKTSQINSQKNNSTVEKTIAETKPQNQITIVFLGDSLTEGYGLNKLDSYPSQTEKKLNKMLKEKNIDNYSVKTVNGGLSGDTTIGGLNRMSWFLKAQPEFLFVALGANDGLRGIDLDTTRANLINIIEQAKKLSPKTTIFLTGMELPLNYGDKYRSEFRNLYSELSKKYQLPFLPFLLEGVAGEMDYNLEDGIHPNEKGYDIISTRVSQFIYPLLEKTMKL